MELQLSNKRQHEIADLMWEAQTNDEVNKLINQFGHDALVVYHMMVAATFDDTENTDLAMDTLSNIFK